MNKKEREVAAARARLREKDPDIIERKKLAAEQARQEREQFYLAEEQRKYGLKRQGKPLSRMPI
jgi:hypothetical protein